ncbi:MAG TPA: helicase C-terminal domain-containing protein [Candidatus Paceibacterota bacterium]
MGKLTFKELEKSFPWSVHRTMTGNQEEGLRFIAENDGRALLETPTGSGKTAIGLTFLRALATRNEGSHYYVVPTKALVGQVLEQYPGKDLVAAYGRNEHECLYYEDEELQADQIPCTLLTDCAHRVDQKTGETFEPGATPCAYLLEKYRAMTSGKIIVCTMAYYIFAHVLQGKNKPAGVVIDEAHDAAKAIRNVLGYRITNVHLERCIEVVSEFDASVARQLSGFLRTFKRIVSRKFPRLEVMLSTPEIRDLITSLREVEIEPLYQGLSKAMRSRRVDAKVDRESLLHLERLTKGINRYVSSLEYALHESRDPLNYVFAVYNSEVEEESRKATHSLTVRGYYTAPLMRKMLGERTVAYSATIGNPNTFYYDSGLKLPFATLESDFPPTHTRIFMPTDTPSLAFNERPSGQPAKVMRQIARACRKFANRGIRSLVVVVSDAERQRFVKTCEEEHVDAITYGKELSAKDAAMSFRDGKGEVLVGTAPNYGEGLDLPGDMSRVTFVLRPSYPPPTAPEAIFETERFGSRRWALWHWRIVIEALQARGRNVRSKRDKGVTIFVSQQFRKFILHSLPKWLQTAYRGTQTFEQAVEETIEVLKK